jgi:hypothetical protein
VCCAAVAVKINTDHWFQNSAQVDSPKGLECLELVCQEPRTAQGRMQGRKIRKKTFFCMNDSVTWGDLGLISQRKVLRKRLKWTFGLRSGRFLLSFYHLGNFADFARVPELAICRLNYLNNTHRRLGYPERAKSAIPVVRSPQTSTKSLWRSGGEMLRACLCFFLLRFTPFWVV